MLTILALLFVLPILALIAAHVARALSSGFDSLPALNSFQLRALSIARERLHAFTGHIDPLIEVRAMARLADAADERAACDRLRAEIAALRATAPLPFVTRVRASLAWAHATSPTLRALARPFRLARYHARTACAATVLTLALLGSACGVVRALPTRAESRERTASVLGSVNATARTVLR